MDGGLKYIAYIRFIDRHNFQTSTIVFSNVRQKKVSARHLTLVGLFVTSLLWHSNCFVLSTILGVSKVRPARPFLAAREHLQKFEHQT